MKLKRVHIWISLTIVIFISMVVASFSIESGKEGYACADNVNWISSPLPKNSSLSEWNTNNINETLKANNFGSITADPAEVSTVINYFVGKGVVILTGTTPGELIDGPNTFPEHGKGICMSDQNGAFYRTVYFNHPRGGGDGYTGNRHNYHSCKQMANMFGASVFSLQYFGQCFVGKTNDIALGNKPNSNGYIASRLDDSRCGGPYGLGDGWTQNVYAKNVKIRMPPKTYYYLDNASMVNCINDLKSQNYTNIYDAICANKKDVTIPK